MSPNAARLLRFAIRFQQGWHTMGSDPKDHRSMRYLEEKGFLTVIRHENGVKQFRLIRYNEDGTESFR